MSIIFNARYPVIFTTKKKYCVVFVYFLCVFLGKVGTVKPNPWGFNSTEPNARGSSATVLYVPKCPHGLSEICTSLSHPELFIH